MFETEGVFENKLVRDILLETTAFVQNYRRDMYVEYIGLINEELSRRLVHSFSSSTFIYNFIT